MENKHDGENVALDQAAGELHEVMVRLGWVSRRRLEQDLDAFGVTAPQFMVLRCIEQAGEGCNMSRLAEASHQVLATMTGIVDRLVERGLVRRERDRADRRAMRVFLTPAGQSLVKQVSEHQREWLRRFLVELGHEERRGMIAMARRYLQQIENSLQ